MKALIKVGYGCNENCTFCHTSDVRHIDGSAAEVHAKIERAHHLGHSMVVLSGGEPTIRPELAEWAAHAARLGMDFGLVTNGLLFAYERAVVELMRHRLKYVYMSLHGGTAEVHDRLVRARTFEQARTALANLSGRGLELTVNVVVTRQNLEALEPIVDLVLRYSDLTLKFSMVQPKGGGDRAFAALMPRVGEVAERVRAAIAYGRARAPAGLRFAHDGIPLCLLPGVEGDFDDLKTHRFATMVEVGEPDFFPVDDADKIQPAPCRGCALRGACPGLFRGYHDVFGDGELRPVHDRPRANSFNYVFETLVPSTGSQRCRLRDDGVSPWDRGRHLFVRNGERIGRYRAVTRDFADVEIMTIKHELEQIYFDRSHKDAPDHFPTDLIPLRRSSLCAPCPERPRCTGLYEPLLEDLFTRDDQTVRVLLASLRGDVLDVGCGEGPYDDVLAPLARAGQIRYVGFDPDVATLARLRARRDWGELRAGHAEAPPLDDAERARGFACVLVLRSWNHLREPMRALSELVALLAPGGTLVIVDNGAFGLARSAAQAARAESSPAQREHYRNDGPDEVHQLAARLPVRLIDRHDLSRQTANQWLLRYERS
jgi:MoaA/NifB/PqqE/SkfB family radical SAM enzyme/SAM-dependent methyltransferase